MIVRLPWVAVGVISALAFGRPAEEQTVVSTKVENVARVAQAADSNTEQEDKMRLKLDSYALYRDFENGERRADVIQNELATIAGDTSPIRWNSKNIKGNYHLVQILSHTKNLESRFEILTIHTLADREHPDDVVTHYSSKILEADERNLASSFVFARNIVQRQGRPTFDESTNRQYYYFLKQQDWVDSFKLREPEGAFRFGQPEPGVFNPTELLNNESGTFNETGDYQYEIPINDTIYTVNLTPRFSELGNLTIEIEMHPINSLVITTFVLVYE